jgi:propanol-preferring alcohol dehydrogenase
LHGYQNAHGHPVTPGHEVAGEVDAIGDGVTSIRAGDRVAVHAIWSCGTCEACRKGQTIFCQDKRGVIGFSMDGGDADYIAAPAEVMYKVPDDITWIQAALMGDGVGTPYHAIKRVGLRGGETVGIFGIGPVGLGSTAIAKFLGARVVAVDINPMRLELARTLGADVTLNAQDPDFAQKLAEITGGKGLDRALDTSNTAATLTMALDHVAVRGTVAFVGEKDTATIHPSPQFLRKEITVVGNWYHEWGDYDEMVTLIRRGLAPERIVTHQFLIAQAPEAFRLFAAGQTGKAILIGS